MLDRFSFAHPKTHAPLKKDGDAYRCEKTGETFPIRDGMPIFVPEAIAEHMEEERSGLINGIKTFLRRFPRLYVALIYVISPVCFVGLSPQAFLKRFKPEDAVISIGAGVHRYADKMVNVDIFPYKGVDVIGDAMALPFATDSIDGVVCEYLLEHVPDPQKVVDEIVRVLKPGATAYLAAPFIYPFHASPNDFFRWSVEGARMMCKRAGAEIDLLAPRSGPTSALVAQLGVWAAIALSFGSETLYGILNIVFTTLFSPLKWLDVVFGRLPTTRHGAGSWHAVIRKP